MTDLATIISIVLIPFLAGNVCSILNRQPRLGVIGRPLARTTMLFCLGVWFLNRPSATATDPLLFAIGLAPWILFAHLMISFIPQDEPADRDGLRFDVLLYSASFLSAICLTSNLAFLILYGESLAISTWLTSTGEDRRRIAKRSIATFILIVSGAGLIVSHTGTTEISAFPDAASAEADHSNFAQFAGIEHESSLAARAGLLLLVVGFAWRIGFFPFERLGESVGRLAGFQRHVSLVIAATLVLTVLLPNLPGYENLGLMLLFTLAIPTLIRDTWRSGRWESADQLWNLWWSVSAALMWISLGLGLYSIRQEMPLGLWLPSGLAVVRLELLSSLGAFIVLTAVTHAYSLLGRPLNSRESLSGLAWTTPFYAVVIIVGVFSWGGVPFLAGFAPRWGVIAGLFEVAGSEQEGADHFFLIAVLVLCCQMVMVFRALMVVQTLCDPRPASRPVEPMQVWRVWPFAVLLFAVIFAEWF